MHTASLINADQFAVERSGKAGGLDLAFPDWDAHDRFGIVVNEPFGALGASLLIQAAICSFYDCAPLRRSSRPQYPQIYAFHVGASHGDLSLFDFWPARHEVRDLSAPYSVLGAVNDLAITRLAVPLSLGGADEACELPSDYVEAAPSGWTDRWSTRERLRSLYGYSSTGRVAECDLRITARTEDLEPTSSDSLSPEQMASITAAMTDDEIDALDAGANSVADARGWLQVFSQRLDEVPAITRERLRTARQARLGRDGSEETYRVLDTERVFGLLASAVRESTLAIS